MTSRQFALSDLCEIVSSKRVFAADYKDEGVPFFRGKEVSQLSRGESVKAELFISDAVYEDAVSRTGKISPGDVLMTAVGTLGNVYRVKEDDQEFYFKDGNVVWLRNFRADVDSSFLRHWLASPLGRKKVLSAAIGSTQAALTIAGLSQIQIQLPSLVKQQAIAKFADTTDSLIRLYQGTASNLEQIAQTIFKSWFIDFDPVHAKARGEQPEGMDAETAELFPDSFEESELGLIPSGWSLVKVENLLSRWKVSSLAKDSRLKNIGRTLVLEQGDSVVAGFTDEEAQVPASAKAPKFIFGDHTCRMRLSTLPFSVFPNTIVLDSKIADTYWAFLATKDLQKFESYRRHWMELAQKHIVFPSGDLDGKFGNMIAPLFTKIDAALLECLLLVEIRDALLPRLISGELEIPDKLLVD